MGSILVAFGHISLVMLIVQRDVLSGPHGQVLGGGADGIQQLPDALAPADVGVLRLRLRALCTRAAVAADVFRRCGSRTATMDVAVVAGPVPIRTGRVAVAIVDLLALAADATCNLRWQ